MKYMLNTQTKSDNERYLGKRDEILLNRCVGYVPQYLNAHSYCDYLYTDRESANCWGCVVGAESTGGKRG